LLLGALAGAAWFFVHSRSNSKNAREDFFSQLPGDATTVAFLDLKQLRPARFLAQILARAPQPAQEEEYAKFVRATGFDYERDLDRVAIAFSGTPQSPKTMAVAEGRFDRKKIEAYSAQFGVLKTAAGKIIFAVALNNPARTAYFTFLRDDQVAVCNDASCFFQPAATNVNGEHWREHLLRLAGTPLFGIMRQDSQVLSALAQRGPGGWRSPQLATLLGQLEWVSIAAKPDGDQLRVVAEGESSNETTIRQLKEMLSGLLILAQAGLDDPKTRKQLDPKAREAYLALLKSAEVQKMERGGTQSVRLMFEVSPELLETTGNRK